MGGCQLTVVHIAPKIALCVVSALLGGLLSPLPSFAVFIEGRRVLDDQSILASFGVLVFLPIIASYFILYATVLLRLQILQVLETRGLLTFTVTLLGTLRDDGFTLFAATATAILLFLSRVINDPSSSQVWWIMVSPIVILVASIDVWLLRFDKAALERVLPHIPFLRKDPEESVAIKAHGAEPDLEDISLRNGLRAANVLSRRISAIYFWPLAMFVQIFGAVAYALPLSDLGGRHSGVEERGADILRITAAAYGLLSSLVGTTRMLRSRTFQFTVRGGDGFRRGTTREFRAGSRERTLLYDHWTAGVDWLATRMDLTIQSEAEFVFFETEQIKRWGWY